MGFNIGKNQSNPSSIIWEIIAKLSLYGLLKCNYAIIFFGNSPFPSSWWSKQVTIRLRNWADLNAHKFPLLFPNFCLHGFKNGQNISFRRCRYVFCHANAILKTQCSHCMTRSILKSVVYFGEDAMLWCLRKSLVTVHDIDVIGEV